MESLAEEEGMEKELKTYFPKIQIYKEWPVTDVAASLKVIEDLLTAHPDVKGIYWWAGVTASSCVQALQAHGYKPGDVKLVGSYSIPSQHDEMRDGWWQYLQPGAPVLVGRTSVQNMAKMFKGEQVSLEISVPMMTIGYEVEVKGTWDQTGWYWHE